MERLCKNCKNWERVIHNLFESINIYTNTKSLDIGDFRKRQENWRDTTFIRTDTKVYGVCSCPKFDDFNDTMQNDSLAVSSHDNEHDFFTGENFGCIHFKEIK